ncbi:hypothetical protein L8R85_02160 [Vibrio splendidus]|nr:MULTISPECIES: hypothetical protein [Vibrio]MDH5919820.1 hypothetical protein [Vibrio splendidus]
MYYILIGKNAVKVDNLADWSKWFSEHARFGSRHVGHLNIKKRKPFKKGGKMLAKVNKQRQVPITISTVFLAMDHNHFNMYGNKPILFESMVFGGKYDDYQARYFTWDEAKEAHDQLVIDVTKGLVL